MLEAGRSGARWAGRASGDRGGQGMPACSSRTGLPPQLAALLPAILTRPPQRRGCPACLPRLGGCAADDHELATQAVQQQDVCSGRGRRVGDAAGSKQENCQALHTLCAAAICRKVGHTLLAGRPHLRSSGGGGASPSLLRLLLAAAAAASAPARPAPAAGAAQRLASRLQACAGRVGALAGPCAASPGRGLGAGSLAPRGPALAPHTALCASCRV